MSKAKYLGRYVIRGLLYGYITIATTIITVIIYLMNTWSNLSFAEIVFHLKTTIAGTNPEMVREGIIKYGIPMIIVIALMAVWIEFLLKRNRKMGIVAISTCALMLLIGDIVSLAKFDAKTKIITSIKNSILETEESEFIENNFIDAGDVEITLPEQKRNLIYIYLESMEMTYADEDNGGAFEENVIPNLTQLSQENENFSGNSMLDGGISLTGTDWTMGAMFAQSSGLPLKVGLNAKSFEDEDADCFFPSITTIGDVLEDNGYKNVLQIGSEAEFAGRELFFTTHGNYEIHDYNYAVEQGLIPEDYYVWWGFEDSKLFEFAKQDLLELADDDQPFNYTMLTVDTHFEDGYVCDECGDEFGDDQYANVISCSDKQVSEFVEWIQKQDFYDNTTIVLCGDHITMDTNFCENVDDDYQRRTYTCIINGAADKKTVEYRDYATIDMFPTTLAALGADLSCDRLGLGTNLYSGAQTLVEEYGVDYLDEEFEKSSPFLESMAGTDEQTDAFEELKKDAYIEVADDDGNIRFRIYKMFYVSTPIESVSLVVKNMDTGEEYKYEAEQVEDINGHVDYGVVHSDIPYEDVENLKCTIYISNGEEYKNYKLMYFTYDMFKIWDIRWDS